MDSLHKYGLLAVAVYFALQWFTTHTLPGWGWLLTPAGLFVIGKQVLPLLLRPTYRATQPRLRDQVFADQAGLRFVDTAGETSIRWEEITEFYMLGIRSVIVTGNGEYDFLSTLTYAEQLKAIIPCLAVNAGQTTWRTGTVSRQQVRQPDGWQSAYCVYHYRSQENCGRLWGLTLTVLFLAGIVAGPSLIAWQSGVVPGAKELGLAVGSLNSLLVLVWLWANYFRAGIRTNEEGITQQTLFGRRFLAWSQARVFYWRGGADLKRGCVEGMGSTITFWKGLGDADRLADEITSHDILIR
ncbi:MAG: hypothetical protein ACRYFS_10650 [Janthinobacterium lividum]